MNPLTYDHAFLRNNRIAWDAAAQEEQIEEEAFDPSPNLGAWSAAIYALMAEAAAILFFWIVIEICKHI